MKKQRTLFSLSQWTTLNVFLGIMFIVALTFRVVIGGGAVFPGGMNEEPKIQAGTWLWDSVADMSEEAKRELIDDLHRSGIVRLSIRIDDYVDIVEAADNEEERVRAVEEFSGRLVEFNRIASEKGIRVYAMGGGAAWAYHTHDYIPPKLTEFVLDFNKQNEPEARFAGIHFDIEPYGQDRFEKEPEAVLTEFARLVKNIRDQVKERVGEEEFALGFDVPFWFDGETRSIPKVQIEGYERKHIGPLLFDILREYDHSYIVIMSYRTHAHGTNGTIEVASKLMSYAADNASDVEVFVGQETADVTEKTITFYHKDAGDLFREAENIEEYFQDLSVYGGVFIHHAKSYLELVERYKIEKEKREAAPKKK